CGLFLLDEQEEFILGTFGTDDHGQTVDERPARHPIQKHPEVFSLSDRLWLAFESTPSYWNKDRIEWLEGKGWNVATPIRSRRRTVGVLYNDTALTHAPLDETQQDMAAVYCSLLGSLFELKRTEASLASERDLLQLLMDNFPDTIYFKDTASRFTRINRAQVKLLGIATPEEALGKTDADFFQSSELRQMFLAEEQRLMTSGEPIIDRVEYNPTAEGRPRWLSASKVPLRDISGQIIGMVGISRDITDRVSAEQREKTISQGLRAVIEVADELMSCADLDMLYRRAVELAREKLQVERCGLFVLDERGWLCGTYGTDLQGKTSDERGAHFQPTSEEWLTARSSSWWTIVESEHAFWEGDQQRVIGSGWVGTTVIRPRDRVIGVLYNDTAITHARVNEAQQEVLAVYCSLLGSLIELKRAEAALRESEALYRQAIEAAGAVPYYLDYATESYVFMGDGVRQLTGLSAAEMHPTSWDTLLQEVYPLGQSTGLSWRQAVQETRQGHITVWRADYRVLTRDGRYCWVTDASVQVLDEQGRPRGAIGILQDITERKQVELALRESEATTRALLEAIPDAFFRFDVNGIFKEYIPSKEFTSLVPPNEFIGNPFSAVLPPDVAQQLDLNFQQVLERGELRTFEYPLLLGDETRYFEARLVKMTQNDVLGMVRDVTNRKQAELALQQREAYLRSIFDNFPYWVWLKDADGHFLAVNQSMAQAFGFEQARNMIGKTDWNITTSELAEKYRADDLAVMESRTQKLVEEIVLDQKEEKWFETFKSPIFDAQGQVIGTTGFAHDITARRQAEAAIRESEALFRQLADNAPAFIATHDETGVTTYLNRAWREFRGNDLALPLKEWSERIHPDDRRRYTHEFQSSLQGQRKFTTEYRLRRADGQYRWLLDTVVPRYAADERFAGFIGIAIDITDRKNAEEALRRSEGRLRLITDNMADSISQVDAEQRLVYVSPSAERDYGHSLRDLLGRPLYDFVHPEDSSRLYHQVVMAIELRVPSLRLEYRYRHAAGNYLWVESEMRLLYDERGDFIGAVFGSRDVSARKQIEADRENLIKELEDKNAELERFTYTVSHDLKSPLITIRGFLGFLEKDATIGNFDRLHADIARIVEATTRMQRLLDELLDLSRIGRMSNSPQEVPFGVIAREAAELVQGRITARGVTVEIAENLPVVYVDHTRLVEAVQNLIDNAVKFMGDQPEPRIVIGALGTERAGMPIFFVEDNGLGIEPEYHERIFGLFNKLDAKSEGTGVGLALVRRIIDLHGGYIWVESDGAGHGSTFFFTLPRPTPTARKS
ncbi:MAG TPA: PAS domain S-box protein, partial [Anaerolineae bacterium]|nr:PAS domain S-box protein [Anaerolineae bacterium]